MIRLLVVVEGQTEEAFVRQVLAPHLAGHDVFASASIVGKWVAHEREHRSRGGGHFKHWRRDLTRHLSGDRSGDFRVTTLFDLYGLPSDFPGVASLGAERDTSRRCDMLEHALASEVGDWRFIPYVQRHEFEALVLAALPALAELLDGEDDLDGLATLRAQIDGIPPEDVNDGRETAPSKRLLAHIPGYVKVSHGPDATQGTGLPTLRASCLRFDAWVRRLEGLDRSGPPDGEALRQA